MPVRAAHVFMLPAAATAAGPWRDTSSGVHNHHVTMVCGGVRKFLTFDSALTDAEVSRAAVEYDF
eukprot:gene6789-65955_t